ncbi:hypothetical protein [Rufibacter hautae]|uniref:Uncharacterized protein n=1 Tax=Rufibacter hautae TaxID=2595005 RepID=A0A5B6TA07_9BACT|nr:hypothetical protein [Rufibacter hautae]KAA3435933.1 hypothetical protein FOA19_23095 [Rufibacter hautae]
MPHAFQKRMEAGSGSLQGFPAFMLLASIVASRRAICAVMSVGLSLILSSSRRLRTSCASPVSPTIRVQGSPWMLRSPALGASNANLRFISPKYPRGMSVGFFCPMSSRTVQ